MPCSALLAASKAEVGFLRHGAWWRSGGVALEGLSWALVPVCHAVRVQLWFGMLRAKALAGVCWWDDGGILDVVLPIGGVILERQPYCTGFSG